MFNKKAQELSIGTLVLIVLGVIVLVLLVLGFSMGWDTLFSKIGLIQGSDLTTMMDACKLAVTTQSAASYCEFKGVKVDGKKEFLNCEDSRIVLESKLSACPASAVKDKCMGLLKSGKMNKEDKYNGVTCFIKLGVTVQGCYTLMIDGQKAVEMDDCKEKADVTYLVNEVAKNKKCCWSVDAATPPPASPAP